MKDKKCPVIMRIGKLKYNKNVKFTQNSMDEYQKQSVELAKNNKKTT